VFGVTMQIASIMMLTKASTQKSMWTTLMSNPREFPTHTNWTKQCSGPFSRSLVILGQLFR
jgi:hypothetical protein